MKVKRALISVSDKTGIIELAQSLNNLGVEILSTGGTSKTLKDAGIKVTDVSEVTGFPEMLDGRVKTLHPKIHGALLALRKNEEHRNQLKKHNITPIDMVVVNLYPFAKTIAKPDVTLEEAIENIDIGGPSMIRSASKNFEDVVIIVNPNRYKEIIKELEKNNCEINYDKKRELMIEAFEHTASYDAMIYNHFSKLFKKNEIKFPKILLEKFEKAQDLRYGENPHQSAAFYKEPNISESCISSAIQLHGKELSFNNILDANSAVELIKEFDTPAVTIIKHTNPCGTACADNIDEAYRRAYDADSLSAFGGVIVLNRKLSRKIAEHISSKFVEIVIAPDYDAEALEIMQKKKDIRILKITGLENKNKIISGFDIKKVVGGILVQDRDVIDIDKSNLKVVTKKIPTEAELEDLFFAWKVVKHVKSNAIVVVKNKQTLGIGAGQMNRVGSVKIACEQAGDKAKGACLASDGLFPKADNIEAASKFSISSIIQPGGAKEDSNVISMADKYNIAMVFTAMRHFKH